MFLVGYIVVLAVVAGALLRSLFAQDRRVDADSIYGAISVYLLAGLIWAMAFALLEKHEPGSFRFPDGETAATFEGFLGFSITTLTTLGYGDVVPTTPRAYALTNCEAIAGQFYLAIVIARFVALHLANTRGLGSPDADGRES